MKLKNRKRWVSNRMATMFVKRAEQGTMIDRSDPKAQGPRKSKPKTKLLIKW